MCGCVPRHHCRACGQVFCDACSSRVAFLPGHDAASGDVALRVCDACFVEGLRFKDAATTRAKRAAVGATTASALAADGESFASHARVAIGDCVLHNVQFGAPYVCSAVPALSAIHVALFSTTKQLSGFVDLPLSSVTALPAAAADTTDAVPEGDAAFSHQFDDLVAPAAAEDHSPTLVEDLTHTSRDIARG